MYFSFIIVEGGVCQGDPSKSKLYIIIHVLKKIRFHMINN